MTYVPMPPASVFTCWHLYVDKKTGCCRKCNKLVRKPV